MHNFLSATFFVDDPAEIDNIISAERARNDIDWNFFDISADESTYTSVAEPLHSMNTAIIITMVILSCVMLILLYLVLRMGLQNRKHEVKVYRALGLSKRNILSQLLLEGLLLALLAFVPAAALAPAGASGLEYIAETMLTTEKEEPREYSDAEMLQAIQNGTLQDVIDEQTRLYTEEPITVDLQIDFNPVVAIIVLAGGLVCILTFTLLQSRELLNAGLR